METYSHKAREKKELQIREAVLLALCDSMSAATAPRIHLSTKEWQHLLRWLDISGLALYFLDHVVTLQQTDMLPSHILARLQQNLVDNAARTDNLFAELKSINSAFQSADLSYAVLKGFSLWPHSVPRPELRSQLDLDFLVAAEGASLARQILEARGYHLRAISGHTWEFKTYEMPGKTLKNLYADKLCRSVELHIEASTDGTGLLARAGKLSIHDICTPVLSPADLLVGQGSHLFKHISTGFVRAAHLIEFRRHVITRYRDVSFWHELQALAQRDPMASMELGMVTLLITNALGTFAPEALISWTVDRLPARARLWVELYGKETILADFPGNKFYLLLQRELGPTGFSAERSVRKSLLPLRLPPPFARARTNETQWMRVQRYYDQLRFILVRLRFHVVEGLRYFRESIRWRQYSEGLPS
jgi:Uncharacterised nucleotidyltransferase